MTNYHCHTQFCDGASTAEEVVIAAIEAGFPALGLSSHAPVPFETCWTMPMNKRDEYIAEVARLKEKYGDKIELYQGLEVDYIDNEQSVLSDHIQGFNSDFLIGSVHFLSKALIDDERWTIDSCSEDFKLGLDSIYGGDIKRLVRDFTTQSAAMMETGGFDIVGHIDKIYQHGCEYFYVQEKWYQHEMISLLELAKEKDYIVEINTKHHHVLDFLFPHFDFFKELKRLNIAVQVNSDCHQKERQTAAYDVAYKALLAAGITEERVLLNGHWQDVKIPM